MNVPQCYVIRTLPALLPTIFIESAGSSLQCDTLLRLAGKEHIIPRNIGQMSKMSEYELHVYANLKTLKKNGHNHPIYFDNRPRINLSIM
jgi:hypothetical protein